MKQFLIDNWYCILMGCMLLAWWIARLTPSAKDDKVVRTVIKIILKALTLVPDVKKGGGRHKLEIVDKKEA
jgi:hypothetical protein